MGAYSLIQEVKITGKDMEKLLAQEKNQAVMDSFVFEVGGSYVNIDVNIPKELAQKLLEACPEQLSTEITEEQYSLIIQETQKFLAGQLHTYLWTYNKDVEKIIDGVLDPVKPILEGEESDNE